MALHSARPLVMRLLPFTYAQYSVLRPSCLALAEGRRQHSTAGPQGDGGDGGLLSKFLGDNQFTTGGITLMVLGAAAAAAHAALRQLMVYGKRHLMVTAEIDSRDDAYRWLMHWLSSHPAFRKSSTVQVITSLQAFGTSAAQRTTDDKPKVLYLPAPGDHLLHYKGKWIWISRRRMAGNPQLAANARLLMETLVLTMWGTSRAPLEALVAEAAAAYFESQKQRTIIYSVDQDGYWDLVGSRPIRPLSTVVLPKHKVERLVEDCSEFLESEEWYSHHGIPYRRGYLLYGPPGTGKTSLVMALAGALQLDIYVVTLSSPRMSDETLRSLLNTASPRSVLLLEDVDAAFVGREGQTAATGSLTFSGLLNAIDGVAAQEGRLLFMTTNHIERLSNALIRPGRVDVRLHLGLATRAMIRRLFVSFYADLPRLEEVLVSARARAATTAAGAAGVGKAGKGRQPLHATHADSSRTGYASSGGSSSSSSDQGDDSEADDDADKRQHAMGNAAAVAAAESSSRLAPGTQQQQQQQQQEPPDAKQRAELLQELEALAKRFAEQLPERAISMAAVQGHLMKHKKDPVGAVETAAGLLQVAQKGSGEENAEHDAEEEQR